MISFGQYQYSREENGTVLYLCEGVCTSEDTKPTTGIENGSKLMEMDTSTLYMFDKESGEWRAWT